MSPGAEILWRKLADARAKSAGAPLLLNLTLGVLLDSYFQLTQEVGLLPDLQDLKKTVQEKAAAGEAGDAVEEQAFVGLASKLASERGQSKIFERDLVAAVLSLAGIPLRPVATGSWQSPPKSSQAQPATSSATAPEPARQTKDDAPPASTLNWKPYTAAPTLEKLGRDLTAEAAAGKLPPVLGRDEDTALVIETLCRDTKRNPLLLGPAGVGKTAIVEGLAQRVVRGEVPKSLVNARIFALQATDLVQGTGIVGVLEERMKALIKEAESPGCVLFLDEIHAVVGAGAGGKSSNDVANILKPALARGAMACIGATTDAEYSRYLVGDAAFERRFQPLRVNELSRDATLAILQGAARRVQEKDGIAFETAAVEAIVNLADRFMRNRYRPDKALDVFQHALARARVAALSTVGVEHIHEIVRRMVSVPLDARELGERLDTLERELVERAGVAAGTAADICKRLRVTMRSMDLHPTRPNTVLLAIGGGDGPAALARLISEIVFGPDTPLIEQDMSILQHPGDVNRLVGTAPGYVGYDVPLQLHLQLAQRPWSVVLFRGADLAHPAVQAALAQALQEGFLINSAGQKVYLSDAVCVLTQAGAERRVSRALGFVTPAASSDSGAGSSNLTPELGACVDVVCELADIATKGQDRWVVQHLLEPLARGYHTECNITLTWDDTVTAWLAERSAALSGNARNIEKFFETEVEPIVVGAIDDTKSGTTYRLEMREGTLRVESQST
jgi:ATP-dependent Clp protease ATP-binding subunit ClpC